jgi:DNA-binding NarL/FixJ family response regulator
MIDEAASTDRVVMVQLEAIERALNRGDVSSALSCLKRTRRRLLGVAGEHASDPNPACSSLTEREVATLCLLPDACLSQKDIALTLGVSPNTVKSHLKSIYQKLGVHSRAEAIEVARRLDLIGRWHVDLHHKPAQHDVDLRVLAG